MGSKAVAEGLLLLLALAPTGCVYHSRPHEARERPEGTLEALVGQRTLEERLARFAPVSLDFAPEVLDNREKQALPHLLRAAEALDELFWEQSTPGGTAWKARLAQPARTEFGRMMLRYLAINHGPTDRRHGNEPFLAVPPQRAAPPTETSRQRLHAVAAHLEKAAACWSNREKSGMPGQLLALASAVVAGRGGDGPEELEARGEMLEIRIEARHQSEVGRSRDRAGYGSRILTRDEPEMERLVQLEPLLGELLADLPVPEADRDPAQSRIPPIVIANLVYATGAARVADHPQVFDDRQAPGGSGIPPGRVLLKNVCEAEFTHILVPLAQKVLVSGQAARLSAQATFLHGLLRLVAHGMGPRWSPADGEEIPAILEQAKDELLGAYALGFLGERQALPAGTLEAALLATVSRVFQLELASPKSVEAAAARLVFFGLRERGVVRYDDEQRAYALETARAQTALRELLGELMQWMARGDRDAARQWLSRAASLEEPARALLPGLGRMAVELEWGFAAQRLLDRKGSRG